MSHTRIRQLGAVRQEFEAARDALTYTVNTWPTINVVIEAAGRRMEDFRLARRNLEITYLIRLFSQFEAILGEYLRERSRRVPRIAENLVNRVASLERIDDPVRDGVHDVRLYRNAVVHPAAAPLITLDFAEALAALNRFLAWLPEPSTNSRRGR